MVGVVGCGGVCIRSGRGLLAWRGGVFEGEGYFGGIGGTRGLGLGFDIQLDREL
jgi:hypothetical protein